VTAVLEVDASGGRKPAGVPRRHRSERDRSTASSRRDGEGPAPMGAGFAVVEDA
jgi:hypothetical protein